MRAGAGACTRTDAKTSYLTDSVSGTGSEGEGNAEGRNASLRLGESPRQWWTGRSYRCGAQMGSGICWLGQKREGKM